MLIGYYLWQVVELMIGGVPTIVLVHFMWLWISLGRILLEGSITTNRFNSMRHSMDLRNVEIGIQLLWTIYLVSDLLSQGDHFAPRLGRHPSFHIWFLIQLSHLHKFHSQSIGFGIGHFACSPEQKIIFDGVKTLQGMFHWAQCCIMVRFILSIHIEFKQYPCALHCAISSATRSGASNSQRLGYTSQQIPAHFFLLLPNRLRNILISVVFCCKVVVRRHG